MAGKGKWKLASQDGVAAASGSSHPTAIGKVVNPSEGANRKREPKGSAARRGAARPGWVVPAGSQGQRYGRMVPGRIRGTPHVFVRGEVRGNAAERAV